MDITQTFKKSWGLLWRYRALWFFGFWLALTTSNALWLGYTLDRNDNLPADNRIIISENQTWYFQGEGLTIDLTGPSGPAIRIEGLSPAQISQLEQEFNITNFWSIFIVAGVVFIVCCIIAIFLRYTSEASIIRMVDENERTDQKATVGTGLRLGWSRVAWRLFLIDLVIGLVVFLFFVALFAIALSPLLLIATESGIAIATGVLFTIVFLAFFVLLAFAASVVLSITTPVIRRACAVDGLGVVASLSQGFRLFWTRFDKVAITWLVWIGTRLVWTFLAIPIFFILTPVILFALLAGLAVGAIPALLTTGIASIFTGGFTPWIIGVIVTLPIFIVFVLAPVIFVNGLVAVFLSTLWTLAYREFRPVREAST
jgi:hypothetical protein